MSCDNFSDIEQHHGSDILKVKKNTSNASNTNFNNKCSAEDDDLNQAPLTFSTYFWTLFASFDSSFIGDLCGIRVPQIIAYFVQLTWPIYL